MVRSVEGKLYIFTNLKTFWITGFLNIFHKEGEKNFWCLLLPHAAKVLGFLTRFWTSVQKQLWLKQRRGMQIWWTNCVWFEQKKDDLYGSRIKRGSLVAGTLWDFCPGKVYLGLKNVKKNIDLDPMCEHYEYLCMQNMFLWRLNKTYILKTC